MRDFVLIMIILGSAPICVVNPYFGILMWYWVSYFNPHRFTWSYAYDFPVALVVALSTLTGTLFAPKAMRSLLTRESLLMATLWGWFTFTYIHAKGIPLFTLHMADASYEMTHISKILLMSFVMILLITTPKKLRGVMLVTAGSLGLLAVKGMLFGLRTSGEARVWGPPDSFLADNNALGLALNMCLPLLFFLARDEKNRWLRLFLRISFVASILTVLLTYSRGGLLGLGVVLIAITLKTRHKALGAAVLAIGVIAVLVFAPASWTDRMNRFMKGDLDSSANQRLVTWETAWHFSDDYPITGGGFDALQDATVFQRYQPRALPEGYPSSGPHSIYFQLLADQGFPGLALFLFIIGSCFWSLWRLRRLARASPSAQWIANYTHMIEVSILGFMTSGAFLGFVYLDLIYQMVGSVVVLKMLYRNAMAVSVPQEEKAEIAIIAEDLAAQA